MTLADYGGDCWTIIFSLQLALAHRYIASERNVLSPLGPIPSSLNSVSAAENSARNSARELSLQSMSSTVHLRNRNSVNLSDHSDFLGAFH